MSGVVGPRLPKYINTYSMDFDAVDDYVNLGNDNSLDIFGGDFTISLWAKWGNQLSNSNGLVNFGGSTNKALVSLGFGTEYGKISFGIGNSTTLGILYDMGSGYNDNQWHSIICKITSGVRAVYVDGIDITNVSNGVIFVENNNTIGARSVGGQNRHFNGSIDEVSLYDKALTFEEISNISTAPKDLTSLNPLLWYRMGDNGAYKSPQWLLPSNENKDKLSNYSFELDGIDDYVNCGNASDFDFDADDAFSISVWFKRESNVNAVAVVDKSLGAPNYSGYMFFIYNNKVYFRIRQNSSLQHQINNNNTHPFNTWVHYVVTYDGSRAGSAGGLNIYQDGALQTSVTRTGNFATGTAQTSADFSIGSQDSTLSLNFIGGIDEPSVFNSELSASQINDIYNGGEPTTISGAVAHYKMGEEATFSGGVWTVPDQIGTNDGTSNAMTIEDRVGSAPSSENNAVTINMDLIDRVEDTP